MMNKFYGDWSCIEDLQIDFAIDLNPAIKILFAAYTYEDYSGDAYVLFEYEGKLYEVSGGHCSCYGLEGQWESEETTKEAIEFRLNNGEGHGIFHGYKKEILDVLKDYQTGAYVYDPNLADKITKSAQNNMQKFIAMRDLVSADTDGPISPALIAAYAEEVAALKKHIEQNGYELQRIEKKLETAEELIVKLEAQKQKFSELVNAINDLIQR